MPAASSADSVLLVLLAHASGRHLVVISDVGRIRTVHKPHAPTIRIADHLAMNVGVDPCEAVKANRRVVEGCLPSPRGIAAVGRFVMDQRAENGRLLAGFSPFGVGIRMGFTPVNTSWPFPRRFQIYERGLSIAVLGNTVWASRETILSIRQGSLSIRIRWALAGGTQSAALSSWFQTQRIAQALASADYEITG